MVWCEDGRRTRVVAGPFPAGVDQCALGAADAWPGPLVVVRMEIARGSEEDGRCFTFLMARGDGVLAVVVEVLLQCSTSLLVSVLCAGPRVVYVVERRTSLVWLSKVT